MKFAAAIFDMDGLMVDSELQWKRKKPEIFADLGIDDPKDFWEEAVGLSINDIAALIHEKCGKEITPEELRKIEDERAVEIYGILTRLLPGVRELIERLQAVQIPMAIASSSPNEWIKITLERFGLKKYFPTIFSVQSMNYPGKPDPAVYVDTIQSLGISPDQTVVFEDSEPGVYAAAGSGAHVVAVPHAITRHGDFQKADLVVDSLRDSAVYEYLELNV